MVDVACTVVARYGLGVARHLPRVDVDFSRVDFICFALFSCFYAVLPSAEPMHANLQ